MPIPNVELSIAAQLPPNTVIRARHLKAAMISYHEWCRRNVWYRRIPRNTAHQVATRARLGARWMAAKCPALDRLGGWVLDGCADPVGAR